MPTSDRGRVRTEAGRRPALRAAIAMAIAGILGVGGISTATADPATPPPGAFSTADSSTETGAIEQLKASYFQNIDAKNWAGLRELLAPDVVVDTTGSGGPVIVGRDNFIAFLKLTLGAAETHHQGFDPRITVTSATTAEAVWRMEDVLIFGGTLGVHGYGQYADRYEKADGRWVLVYSKLTRTRLDLIKPDGTVIDTDVPLERIIELVQQATGQ
ncbi:nuclear transport factor 2 family protein [Nocardia sp. N2S4-5]|uniref:nuclear transport factor 2 family protein n=1 Tax=Nocardia sp. N2S4-5 TaxID=3351565 RepID=UPI0037CEB220